MERLSKLGYDVGVNVVANLIAAAIIYLVGAAGGLFPRDLFLLTITVMLLGVAALMAVAGLAQVRWPHSRVRRYVEPALLLTMTVTLLVTAIGGTEDTEIRVTLSVAAVGCLLVAIVFAVAARGSARDGAAEPTQALDERDKGPAGRGAPY